MSLVDEIHELCAQRKYDEAIAKTNELKKYGLDFAVRAHLLVMEHEHRYLLDNQRAQPAPREGE